MIVLDERQWAEDAIAGKKLGKKPSETLRRVAKYYRQIEGRKRSEVIKLLEDFIKACDPSANILFWERAIKAAAKAGEKYPIIQVDGVDITEAEFETIRALEGTQRQRLAFTLLCVAKYHNAIRSQNNNWVNEELKSVLSLSGLHIPKKQQLSMIHEMYKSKLIGLSNRVDNTNLRVLYVNEDSPVALRVDDFRNLGNQYLMYLGERFFPCVNCGLVVRRKSNVQKYCPDCASEIHIQKTIASMMRNSFHADKVKDKNPQS